MDLEWCVSKINDKFKSQSAVVYHVYLNWAGVGGKVGNPAKKCDIHCPVREIYCVISQDFLPIRMFDYYIRHWKL